MPRKIVVFKKIIALDRIDPQIGYYTGFCNQTFKYLIFRPNKERVQYHSYR